MNLFLDVLPISGGVGIAAAVVFFVLVAVAGLIAFKLLKRSVKMAVRMAIVAIVLLVGVAGSIALWSLAGGSTDRPTRPTRNR